LYRSCEIEVEEYDINVLGHIEIWISVWAWAWVVPPGFGLVWGGGCTGASLFIILWLRWSLGVIDSLLRIYVSLDDNVLVINTINPNFLDNTEFSLIKILMDCHITVKNTVTYMSR
jgi:hypothetical protein